MSRRRPLTDEERAIWRQATKDIVPLHPKQKSSLPPAPTAQPVRKRRHDLNMSSANVATQSAKAPDFFRAGDPRAIRRLSRGSIEIDATLDLHGHNQHTGFIVFRQFLLNAVKLGNRNLLIITGKGRRSPQGALLESEGVLRRRVRDWILAPDLARHIARAANAHQRHGGDGALYIVLKNKTSL